MPVHSQHQFTAEVVKYQQIKISMKTCEHFPLPMDGTWVALLVAGVHFYLLGEKGKTCDKIAL